MGQQEGVHRRQKFRMQSIPEKEKKTFIALLANTPLREPTELKDMDREPWHSHGLGLK